MKDFGIYDDSADKIIHDFPPESRPLKTCLRASPTMKILQSPPAPGKPPMAAAFPARPLHALNEQGTLWQSTLFTRRKSQAPTGAKPPKSPSSAGLAFFLDLT